MSLAPQITQDRLKQLLRYSRATGHFRWRVAIQYRRVGSVAGSMRKDGYVAIHLDGRPYLAHRLAWLYVYGCMPSLSLDHRDGNRSNNQINNLRLATKEQQIGNAKVRRDSRSGVRGVRFRVNSWEARIKANGKRISLGYFGSKSAAAAAYRAAARMKWGRFTPDEALWRKAT